MAVYDRWHKTRPRPREAECREHKMVPAAEHGDGDRWQVRWRDEEGAQIKRNFARKTGKDPEKCADAFDGRAARPVRRDPLPRRRDGHAPGRGVRPGRR